MVHIQKILCPVDFSECAENALREALFLAEGLGAEIEVIHAWETPVVVRPDLVVWMDGAAGPALTEIVKARSETAMKQLLEKLPPEARARMKEVHVLHGPPSETIVRYAEDHGHDLIVLGSHGRTGLSRWLLGSVAEQVVRRASCPVLVVRADEATRSLSRAS